MLVANGYAPDPRVHKEAKTLQAKGYSVSVICWDRERKRKTFEVIDGIRIRRFRYLIPTGFLSFTVSGLLFLLDCLVVLLKQGLEDRLVIHCHDFNTLPVGYLLHRWKSSKFRLVYDSHESFPDLLRTIAPRIVVRIVKAVEKLMLNGVDALITANDAILRNLRPSSRIPNVAIYNTPPLSVLSISESSDSAEISRLRHEFGAESFIVLYHGVLQRYRGLGAILDAADLARHCLPRKVIFAIVGEGPLGSSLRSEVQKKKLTGSVRLYPHMDFDRVMLMVKGADTVYIGFEPKDPNNYFASPNKLFEAMAMEKPVLASGFGFLGRLVQRIDCGVIMESVNGPSIIAGIQKLFDEKFKKKCAANGLFWFKSHYNWEVMAQRLESVYADITSCSCVS